MYWPAKYLKIDIHCALPKCGFSIILGELPYLAILVTDSSQSRGVSISGSMLKCYILLDVKYPNRIASQQEQSLCHKSIILPNSKHQIRRFDLLRTCNQVKYSILQRKHSIVKFPRLSPEICAAHPKKCDFSMNICLGQNSTCDLQVGYAHLINFELEHLVQCENVGSACGPRVGWKLPDLSSQQDVYAPHNMSTKTLKLGKN
ncbi:hypothetical protein CPB83DRAFT_839173 [Crepidotus variabilis]|uniref:Uncharacterized protein n=1 Tax=Crepidotus variabilis TaxID=179855 RepID=A0A9P6JKV5_9AGAR|nr:hypothetical protein CPB83DRAFT_839173 [Crepidotus variabilis]